MSAQKLVHDDFQKSAQQLLIIPHLLPDYSLPTARQPIAPQKMPDNCLTII